MDELPIDGAPLRVGYDAGGRLRVVSPDLPPMLTDFLETDVGPFPDDAARVLAGLEGPDTGFKAVGNLYVLQRQEDRVTLRNLYDASVAPLAVPRSALLALLRQWAAACLATPSL